MNEDKFTGKADSYAAYRPSYPSRLLDTLYTKFVTKHSVIADVGSGTGKFAKLLLDRGSTVYCVEPNHDMMKKAGEQLCGYDGYRPVYASAENTTLPDGSVDFVTAAQAFHWFNKKDFARECKRITKGKANCALIWNSYDVSSIPVRELEKLNFGNLSKFKGFAGGCSPENGVSDFFEEYETYNFVQNSHFNFESFVGRCFSSSYSPDKQSDEGQRYLAHLESFFRKYSEDGELILPLCTICHVGAVL